MMPGKPEVRRALFWGVLFTAILAGLIVVGSRNLSHFDAALVGYTFAVLFALFGIVYRYAIWLQRPPTAMYWKQGWQAFLAPRHLISNLAHWVGRCVTDIALNRFIWIRGRLRWLAHWTIMWGCALAVGITFPLVFGWLHFESVPGDFDSYRISLFGFPTADFSVHSLFGFLLFHGLVWSAVFVIVGVMIAMRRRMRDEGAAAVQIFAEDFLPLVLLFAVSLTGLLLTSSYTWMKGYGYDFLAILHAVTVIFTLLWLPFGKFFHIFQRPAQLGVTFYKDLGRRGESATCRRCAKPFSSRMHVEDLIRVEKELGYSFEAEDPIGHYQWVCPPCRRALFALAQGRMWHGPGSQRAPGIPAQGSSHVNPGLGEGPLGEEDRENFHP
ncbi:MAG: MFS transporter [Armatimonadetes bacterium]|nr:MFS transporter [Armatimonadota bacterium]